MKLRCAGCGKTADVGFSVWWFYWFHQPKPGPYPHLKCFQDLMDQMRLDGLDE